MEVEEGGSQPWMQRLLHPYSVPCSSERIVGGAAACLGRRRGYLSRACLSRIDGRCEKKTGGLAMRGVQQGHWRAGTAGVVACGPVLERVVVVDQGL